MITAPRSVATMSVIGDEKDPKRSVVVDPMSVVKLFGSAIIVSIVGQTRGTLPSMAASYELLRGMNCFKARAMKKAADTPMKNITAGDTELITCEVKEYISEIMLSGTVIISR